MQSEIFTIAPFSHSDLPFVDSAFEKLEPKLHGVFAVYSLTKTNTVTKVKVVYIGFGYIKEELQKLLKNECVINHSPQYFAYARKLPSDAEFFKNLKDKASPLCR